MSRLAKVASYLPARPHGESGWVGRVLTAGVAVAVLATARPADAWVWVVLGAGFAVFLAGSVLMAERPYAALGLLSIVAVSNALIAGYPRSNALVLVLVAITDVAVLDFKRHGNRPIIAVGLGVAAAYAVSAWWFDQSDSWYFTQLMWTAVLVAFGLNRRQYEVRPARPRSCSSRPAWPSASTPGPRRWRNAAGSRVTSTTYSRTRSAH